jgi:hypothetical protein
MFDFGTMALLYLISVPVIGRAVKAMGEGVNQIVNRVKAVIPPKGYKTLGPSQVQEKDKRSKDNKTIIGVKNPSETKSDGLRVLDFTSYNDRALCYWYNSSGSTAYAYDFGLRGQLVYRLSGMNSMIWEWSNYGDIDINGEKEVRIGNNFIVSQSQVEDIGDFARKELAPHNMYQLMVYGCHPYMEIGDIYRLQIDYTMPTGESQIELIDVNVEIRGVKTHRACGTAGETQLIVRVPSGEWTKTTSTRARKILSGLPFDNLNRSNVITVGAYDYAGQADIYCDGVADNIQIQNAIDNLYSAGGGTVQLVRGSYRIATTISVKGNIKLCGEGDSTVLYPSSADISPIISAYNTEACTISSFCVDGDGNNITYTQIPSGIILDNSSSAMIAENITVRSVAIESSSTISAYIFAGINTAINCMVDSLGIDGSGAITLNMFYLINSAIGCRVKLCHAYDNHCIIYGYSYCKSVTTSYLSYCTNDGSNGKTIGFYNTDNISSCIVNNNTSVYNVTGFDNCTNLSSCSSNNNTGQYYWGFNECLKITVCGSNANTGGAMFEHGFFNCFSVQQCYSDDAAKYVFSYSDSGTSYTPCADTYQGGFNS